MVGGYGKALSLWASLLIADASYAGFLELPEVVEVPELERKSMLKDLDIPSVRERDPNPDAGPRLNVAKFKLQGIVEYPELGITRADIEKLIDTIRFDLMEEYRVLPSGFTETEIEQVSELLGEIEDESVDRPVNDLDLQKLVWLVREQRSKRGITLGQIEGVADRITQFYRERGFILAKAYIPEQEVREGVVTLTLLLGTLGGVELSGNQLYGEKRVASVLDGMLGEPVTSDAVEEDLYLINDYPGLSVVGYFEPGEQVGDTRLQLDVQAEHRYQGFARLDNHGSDQTGKYRLYAEARLNNPAGLSDQLTLGALNSFYPDNTTYGQLKYSASVFSPRLFVNGDINTNQFVLGKSGKESLDQLELTGETNTTALSVLYKLRRSRIASHSVMLTGSRITSKLVSRNDLISLDGLLDNEVDSVALTYLFDVLNEESRRLHHGSVSVLSGQLESKLDVGKEKNFLVVYGDYSVLTFWNAPFMETPSRILFNSAWQYSDNSLSSLNQFSLAGPTVAKAFPINTFSADSGIYAGVQWTFDKPGFLDFQVGETRLSDMIQPNVFLDVSYGIQKSLTSEKDVEAQLVDAGFGFQFFFSTSASGNIQFAFPVSKSFSSDSFDDELDSMRTVFDLQYIF
jgi:hemolysin activation/secretion protein